MTIQWQHIDEKSVTLVGKLSQTTVTSLLPIKKRLRTYNSGLTIDLSKVTKVDSAGLAYLIELKQYCENSSIEVHFINVTNALTKLIALYNAEQLLEN